MGIGQELGQVHRHARDLIDAIAAITQLRLAEQIIKEPGSDFPGKKFLPGEPLRAIRIHARPCSAQLGNTAFLLFLGVVRQFAAMKIQQSVIYGAKVGQQFR